MKKTKFTLSFLIIFNLITMAQNGVTAHWELNGNYVNSVGSGFTGTNIGMPTFTSDRKANPSSAISFGSGRNQLINFGDILDTMFSKNNATFTVTGWANTISTAPYVGGNYIVTKSFGSSGPYQWHIYHDIDGYVKAVASTDAFANNFAEAGSQNVVSNGTWFHFSLVFDGNLSGTDKLKLFINGIEGQIIRQGGSLSGKTYDSPQELCIGGAYSPIIHSEKVANGYNGSIDDVRIYNKSLTKTEILSEISKSSNVIEVKFAKNNLVLFPNPTKENLTIINNSLIVKDGYTIEIKNLLGKVVYSKVVEDENTLSINLSEVASKGIYFVELKDNLKNVLAFEKVILQ
jgi:hypothetical protein